VAAQLNAQDIFLSFQEDVLAEESTRERVVLEPRLLTPTTQGAIQDLMVPLLLQDMYQALLSNLSEVAMGLSYKGRWEERPMGKRSAPCRAFRHACLQMRGERQSCLGCHVRPSVGSLSTTPSKLAITPTPGPEKLYTSWYTRHSPAPGTCLAEETWRGRTSALTGVWCPAQGSPVRYATRARTEGNWGIKLLQIQQEVRTICKTRNHLS